MSESYPVKVLGWHVNPSGVGLCDTLEVNICFEGEEQVALVPITALPISCLETLDGVSNEELLQMLRPYFDEWIRRKNSR
ncbi:MAG: hypothetical protein F4W92_09005 [Gammaproteobacteria bacterium]|nr:hypothetical protein [Gammaproteobacteria bacterium]